MKKIFSFLLSVALVASMSVTALAAGGFVSSPTGKPAPEVESFEPSDDDCTAEIVVTPYGDRDELSADLLALLEKAYGEILGADDLTKLNTDLAALAKKLGVDAKDLAVSDLFDIHLTNCDNHDEHTGFDIVLSADTFKNFVGLLHMNKDGEWELVKDAKVINDGEHLSFSVDSFSPFAVVVDTTGGQTGDNGMIFVYALIMVASASALVFVIARAKKQKVVD